MTRRYHWIPSPRWEGRRWELEIEEGGVRVSVGRVVRFDDDLIEAAVNGMGFKPLRGPHASLSAAAEGLVEEVKNRPLKKSRR